MVLEILLKSRLKFNKQKNKLIQDFMFIMVPTWMPHLKNQLLSLYLQIITTYPSLLVRDG